MKAPKLLENESAKSFKKRVAAWEKKTGQKYPQSFTGQTDEERILSGAIQMGSAFESKKDYSKDYDLDQIAKEESLSPEYYQSYRDSKEGKKFLQEQEEIQSNVDQDLKEQAYARAASGEIDYGNVGLPGGDEEDDTSSGIIEQTPTGDDGVQASIENENETVKSIERQIAIANNEKYLKSVSWDGMNRTYTSNYREAVKNAAGWSAYYDDSPDPNNPIARSDVFTRGEDGQPLGVMTRSQRRAYDERMHEAKMNQQHQKNADEATGGSGVYGEKDTKGQGTLTEWTTDQEANEGGKVITGGESAKTDVSKGSETNTIFDPNKNKKKGGS